MKYQYQVGDRVTRVSKGLFNWSEYGPPVDTSGEIVLLHNHNGLPAYGVDWDVEGFSSCHECGGEARSGHGYYVMEDEIWPEYMTEVDMDQFLRLLEVI